MHHLLKRVRTATVSAFAVLCGSGCAVADNDEADALLTCMSTIDCFNNEVCINNACVVGTLPSGVVAEITPQAGSSFVRAQVLDVAVDRLPLAFTLPVATTYEVEVLDGQLQRIPANLSLFNDDGIPGRELVVDEFLRRDEVLQVRLIEDAYSVVIRPNEGPPLEVPEFTARTQPSPASKVFLLPSRFRRVFGTVVSSRSNQVRLAGIRVQATGIRSGLTSTASITGSSGAFEVLLPDTDETFFRLRGTPTAGTTPAWSYEQTVRVEVDSDREFDVEMELADDDDIGTARVQVVGISSTNIPEVVSGALVTLTATVPGVDVPPAYTLSGTTDTSGLVVLNNGVNPQLPIIAARYSVEVSTRQGTPFSSTQTVIDLTDVGRGFTIDRQISLPPRTVVDGEVLSAGDVPQAGSVLTFIPQASNAEGALVVTEPSGRFTVALDPGLYLVVIEPPPPSGTDLAAVEPVPVATRSILIDPEATQTLAPIVLPIGSVVMGSVLQASRQPEPNARVEFFVVRSNVAIPLARATTDERGAFTVILGELQ